MNTTLFSDFYREYLGLDDSVICNDVHVCRCKYRDIPINKRYFYKIIATNYNREKIISLSPELDERELCSLCTKINFDTIGVGDILDDLMLPQYKLSYMDRMLLETPIDMGIDRRSAWAGNNAMEYQYLEEYRKYIALMNGDLVGYCKVSDVISGFGNLVVWVEESRRRLGIAESLVKLMIKKCYEEGIVPMYVVKTDNYASIALAKKLGFQVKQRELVVSFAPHLGL